MRDIFKYLLCIVIPTMSFSSCKLDELEDPELYLAYIPITMDWSESNIDEEYTQNVSIYFYPKDGGDPYILISGNINFAIAKIPIGEYSVLIQNDTFEDLLGITFNDIYSYNRAKAMVSPLVDIEQMYYTPSINEYMAAPQDKLALWSMDYFRVTDDMVNFSRNEEFEDYIEALYSRANDRGIDSDVVDIYSYITDESPVYGSLSQFTDIKLLPSTTVHDLNIRVNNLSNAEKIECIARGYASGVTLSNNNQFLIPHRTNSYKFDINTRKYDVGKDSVDGYISHQFVTFGADHGAAKYDLVINIIISSGQLYTFERDITDIINSSNGPNIDILIDGNSEYGMITLPEGKINGFGVNGWEDGEDLELN